MRRARMVAELADLVVGIFDASQFPTLDSFTLALMGMQGLAVFNKVDLTYGKLPNMVGNCLAVSVSCKSGAGLEDLMRELESRAAQLMLGSGGPVLSRQRHRDALVECRDALVRFEDAVGAELAAEELRHAAHALGRVTGRVDVEDILDVIFRDFCIGK